jgi:hypothetical protein
MLGETGTEQFTVTVRRDDEIIRVQPVHDPFIRNTTIIGISRWDLFKALFRKQYTTRIFVAVDGSSAAQRAIMMLDPVKLKAETEADEKAYREGLREYSPANFVAHSSQGPVSGHS